MSQATFRRRLRLLGLTFGGLFFLWLPVEDANERWVILFALAITGLGVVRIWLVILYRLAWWAYPIFGGLAGLLVTPIALLLMAVKNGVHSHTAPDFTANQIVTVIQLTIVWVSAGFLIGFGAGLWKKEVRQIH